MSFFTRAGNFVLVWGDMGGRAMKEAKLKIKLAAYNTFKATVLGAPAEAFVDEAREAGGLPITAAHYPVYVKGMCEVLEELRGFADAQVLDLMLKLGYLKVKKLED